MRNALCKTSEIYVLKFDYGGVIYNITNNFYFFIWNGKEPMRLPSQKKSMV